MPTAIMLALSCFVAQAQTFDVATVKPAVPLTPNGRGMIVFRGPSGGPGTRDPGRIDYPNMSLRNLLMTAYDVKPYQITGPGWLDTERFDVTATLPPDTTKEQFRVMMQNLLAERFKLAIHRETKELPGYALVVNKGGPKMTESAPAGAGSDPDAPLPPLSPNSGPPKIGPDGFPVLPPMASGHAGIFNIMMPGRARLVAQQQTMTDLADRLTGLLNRPVIDATGLTAKYDFTVTFSTEGIARFGPMGPIPPGPPPGGAVGGVRGNDSVFVPEGEAPMTMFGALQAQVGLKLEPRKANVEFIIVDHAEKTPTEN